MSRVPFSTLLASLVLAACQPGGTQFTALQRQALADSVRTFLNEWVETVNRGDVSALVPYYADDDGFHWAEDGRLRYPSHGSLVTAFDSLARTVRGINLVVDQPKIVLLTPELAALSATFRQSISDTSGQVVRFAGAFTTVLQHREDGWKFLLGHASTNPDVQ